MDITCATPGTRYWNYNVCCDRECDAETCRCGEETCNRSHLPVGRPQCSFVWLRGHLRGETRHSVTIIVCGTDLHHANTDDSRDATLHFGVCVLPRNTTLDIGQNHTSIDEEIYQNAVDLLGFDLKDRTQELKQLFGGGKMACYFSSLSQFIYDCGETVGLTVNHDVRHSDRPERGYYRATERLVQEEIWIAKVIESVRGAV